MNTEVPHRYTIGALYATGNTQTPHEVGGHVATGNDGRNRTDDLRGVSPGALPLSHVREWYGSTPLLHHRLHARSVCLDCQGAVRYENTLAAGAFSAKEK